MNDQQWYDHSPAMSVQPPGGALSREAITFALPSDFRGLQVHVYDRVRSTNDTAAALLKSAAQEPVVAVFAEHQEGGRGRRGRSWSSPSGFGLLGTMAMAYPAGLPEAPGEWPLLAALSIRRALALETGLEIAIKWPNDLLIGGKKVCGILTELIPVRAGQTCLAIGAGINVNTDLADFPDDVQTRATSLKAVSGISYDRNRLAAQIICQLVTCYTETLRGVRFAHLRQEMLQYCCTLGQSISTEQGNQWLEGVAETIDDTGALHLIGHDGVRHRIISGEIVQRQGIACQK